MGECKRNGMLASVILLATALDLSFPHLSFIYETGKQGATIVFLYRMSALTYLPGPSPVKYFRHCRA